MNQQNMEFRGVDRVRSALANAAVYRAISQIAGAATYILLVRIMTEYDYGIYNLFYSIPAVMGAILSLGIGNALHRFLPEYLARKDYGLARHFVSWALRLRLLTSLLFISLCLVFWDRLAPIFEVTHLKQYFLIFAVIIVTHFQCRIITLALSANLMQQWSSGLNTGFTVAKLAGYLIATTFGVSLETILIVDLAAYLIWYGTLRVVYHTKLPRPAKRKPVRFTRDERTRVAKYAAFYNFNDVGVVALKSTPDRLFIAAFLNPVAVGAYAFCTGLNAMIQRLTPVAFFNGVIEPLVFTLDYNKQKPRARGYFQFLLKINYLVQFPILIVIAAVPEQIIHVVFGGKFIEYQYLLIAAFAFPAMYRFQDAVMIMAQLGERAGIILASKIFAAYNIVAALVLIPVFGVYGAILATGTAQLFKSIFVWFFVREVACFRGMGGFFLSQLVLWSLCWAAVTYLVADMSNLVALIVALLFVGVCSLLGLRLAHFNEVESNLIRKVGGPRASHILETTGVIQR